MRLLCESGLGALGHETGILQAENRQKSGKVEPVYLSKYRY